jgi:hypothetical protein
MGWMGHVACTGEMRDENNILVVKRKGTRRLGRPRRRWENKNEKGQERNMT